MLTFREVAHENSFSRAAENLALTQPSVSHQVSLLEKEIGLRLIHRGPGGMRLTKAGEVLLEHADQIAWRLELADRQIAAMSEEHNDLIRIGAFPTALGGYMPSVLARLTELDPDLRVHLAEITSDDYEERFLRGEFDLVVIYQDSTGSRREIPGTDRIDLLKDHFLVGLPADHHLADVAGPIDLNDLASDGWIFPSANGFLVEACREAGFEPRIVSTTHDPIATRGLIARGLGVGWVSSLMSRDFQGGATREVANPIRQRDVYALLPPGDRHPRAAETIEALKTVAGQFVEH